MKRKLQAIAVIVLFGIAKLGIEQRSTAALRDMKLRYTPMDLGMMENIGQAGFTASLGGLRALVASITYMQAYAAFENVEWGKVDTYFTWTTRLQPREASYWDEASWHMAYNAASYYQRDQSRPPGMREELFKAHIARGVEILRAGLEYNPENSRLWGRLGDVMSQRVGNMSEAAEDYFLAAKYSPPGQRAEMFKRQAGYKFAEASDPVSWKRGYDLLKDAYDHGWKVPGVIIGIKTLEPKLQIPLPQRIADPMPKVGKKAPAPNLPGVHTH